MKDKMSQITLLKGEVSPHRVHALLKLVRRLRCAKKEDILSFLQPQDLTKDKRASKAIYKEAINYHLIVEQADGTVMLDEKIDSADQIESVDAFRAIMQKRLLGIYNERHKSYQLNLLMAWYAVQDERIFSYKTKYDLSEQFNKDMYLRDDLERMKKGRGSNPKHLDRGFTWAAFLGWGRIIKVGKEMLLPDAHLRLQGVLPELLSPTEGRLPFRVFAERLAEMCPELDGGVLFEKCWQACRRAETRGNRLSLILSTGLRVLHEMGDIELTRQADATTIWRLYPAQGHPLNEITHIQIKESLS